MMDTPGCTTKEQIHGGRCPLSSDGTCARNMECPLMQFAFDYTDTDKHAVVTNTYYNQTPAPRHSGPPARLQCPFNNVPCMRQCAGQELCQLDMAHNNTPAPFDTLVADNALSLTPHWKPSPPPPARYDGSIDDWDVDDFTPPPPPTPSPRRRIEAILARLGVTIDMYAYEEIGVDFEFEGETIHCDNWQGEE